MKRAFGAIFALAAALAVTGETGAVSNLKETSPHRWSRPHRYRGKGYKERGYGAEGSTRNELIRVGLVQP